jgi:hypothetical protein
MTEKEYLDMLEAVFCLFVAENYSDKMKSETIAQVINYFKKLPENGFSAEDAVKYMLEK